MDWRLQIQEKSHVNRDFTLVAYLLIIYLFTSWSWVLLEKLISSQLVEKLPAFYGTWRFITENTIARHLSLSWVLHLLLCSHNGHDATDDDDRDMWCMIWYIFVSAIGFTPGGSSTVHIYTQTIQRTTQSTQIHRTQSTQTIHRITQFTN